MQKPNISRVAMAALILLVSVAAAEPQQAPVKPADALLPGSKEASNDVPFRLRVDVNLAQIDAVVLDRMGRPIDNLRVSDFRLFENDVELPIQAFSRDALPLAMALVLDRHSSNMDKPVFDRIKKAASQNLSLLKPGDSVSLFAFDYTVEMLEGLTTDRQRVADRIGPIARDRLVGIPLSEGGIQVAVYEATAYLARTAPDKRRVVILISNNHNYISANRTYIQEFPVAVSVDQTIQMAVRNETVVYSVKPGDGADGWWRVDLEDVVPRIAVDTGGEIFDGSRGSVEKALSNAIGRLKARYTLGYNPGHGGGSIRRVEIRLADRFGKPSSDYSILARSDHYYEQPVNNAQASVSTNMLLGAETGTKIEFVKVAPGSFIMGSECLCGGDFKPVHRVTLTKDFELGRFEVTQAQWQAVMGSNPSNIKGDTNPVNNVSWDEIQEFIRKMNMRNDGYRYRLPTEAEWEYAGRAGTTGPYGVALNVDAGHAELDEMGWYDRNSGGHAHPVGQKQPNAWGFYDIHGNVWEWVADWYGADYYSQGGSRGVTDPKGPSSGTSRVLRGGSWNYLQEHARVSTRRYSAPSNRSSVVGFRLLRERS